MYLEVDKAATSAGKTDTLHAGHLGAAGGADHPILDLDHDEYLGKLTVSNLSLILGKHLLNVNLRLCGDGESIFVYG